jgi:hypothetical protein
MKFSELISILSKHVIKENDPYINFFLEERGSYLEFVEAEAISGDVIDLNLRMKR